MIGDYLRNESSGGVLARFTRDLTADARAGRLEPFEPQPHASLQDFFFEASS